MARREQGNRTMTSIRITRREVSNPGSQFRFTEYSVRVGRRVVARAATYQRALAIMTGLASR